MKEKNCPTCKHQNSFEVNFCTQCGSKLIGVSDNQAHLCVLDGEPTGAVFLVRKGRTTIGHDSSNLIVLGDDLISSKHAAITFDDENYRIEDRNSKNGVFVNGVKIKEKKSLVDGSVIKIGSTILKFEHNNGSSSGIQSS